jgi:hypothetical protein
MQNIMRPFAAEGIYFHAWSSEDMMQTVSLRDLRNDPLRTLLYIHIQPPAFDAVRAGLAQFWPTDSDQAALRHVDRSLYLLGGIMLGLLVALAFLWLSAQCGIAVAVVGSLLLMLHPATIFFASYLDSTLLSTVLVFFAYYLLWRLKNRRHVSMLLFGAVTLALFFTRSIFQWPAIALLAACLALFGVPRSRWISYLVVTGLISGLFLAKQNHFFGLLSTSSFAGVSLANSIGRGMGSANYAAFLSEPGQPTRATPSMPSVLTSKTKIDNQPNYNHIDYLSLNQMLLERYRKELLGSSVDRLAGNYLENAAIYFRPSSSYSSGHIIVEHLRWRSIYDRLFSAPVLPILLLVALVAWCARVLRARSFIRSLGLLIPALFVFIVSIASDKGENMRFKFFLEPVMLIFLVSQCHALTRLGLGKLAEHRHSG